MDIDAGIIVGSLLGVAQDSYYRDQKQRRIIRAKEVGSNYVNGIYQSNEKAASINIYSYGKIIKLPLTDELFELSGLFDKVDNEWVSKDSLISVSRNNNSKKGWSVKIFDESGTMVLYATLDYINELQLYCSLYDVKLNIKLGTVRTLYQDYIDNV